MGTRLDNETTGAGKSYKNAIYALGPLIVKRFRNLWLHPDFIFNLTTIGRKQKNCLRIIRKFTENIIKERKTNVMNKRTIENGNTFDMKSNKQDNYVSNTKKRNAMLDLLISNERDGIIDDAGIQEEVDTFMFEVCSERLGYKAVTVA